MWLYQMNPTADFFSPEAYRLEVWEGQPWWWRTGNLFPRDAAPPRPGQRIVFYFTGDDTATRGFYGWGIIQRWIAPGAETDDAKGHLEFKITAPSDHLKMHPWNTDAALKAANKARRNTFNAGTLFWIDQQDVIETITKGISAWVAGHEPA
jgi:hypothetical protein